MRKAVLIGAFGSVLLRLTKAKEMQICGSFFNLNELKGTWNILYSESHLERSEKTVIVENVNWKWEFSDSYGGVVILTILQPMINYIYIYVEPAS